MRTRIRQCCEATKHLHSTGMETVDFGTWPFRIKLQDNNFHVPGDRSSSISDRNGIDRNASEWAYTCAAVSVQDIGYPSDDSRLRPFKTSLFRRALLLNS